MRRSASPTFRVPKLANGRGNLPIDCQYKGIGRIRCSSGTTDEGTYLEIRQMMDDLYNVGNFDTLKAIQAKTVLPIVVLSQTKNKGIKTSITADLNKPILETIYRWLDTTSEIKDSTKNSYRGQIKSFEQVVLKSDTMMVLLERLKKYRKSKQQKYHETFNKTKAVLMSFVKDTYGKTSHLYFEIQNVEHLKRIRPKIQHGLEVSDIVSLTNDAPEQIAEMIWSMTYTGMRSYEYLQTNDVSWKAEKVKDPISKTSTDSIYIHKPNPGKGNKGQSRRTLNPFPDETATASVQYRQFNRYLKALGTTLGQPINQTIFRHTFVHWCLLSGIPRDRVDVYMGHKDLSTLGHYKGYKDHAYMDLDNETLRTYIVKSKPIKVNPKAKDFFTL